MKVLTATTNLFNTSLGHALEALRISLVHLWDLKVVLLQFTDKLGSVELAVASAGLNDLVLLLESKVLPGEIGSDVLLEQSKNLVVGDCARVCEVVNTRLFVVCQEHRGREKIVKDGIGVGDVDYMCVLGDLGDKVSAMEIVADGHSKSENKHVGVRLHDLVRVSLWGLC
jgi:hypothetical protein